MCVFDLHLTTPLSSPLASKGQVWTMRRRHSSSLLTGEETWKGQDTESAKSQGYLAEAYFLHPSILLLCYISRLNNSDFGKCSAKCFFILLILFHWLRGWGFLHRVRWRFCLVQNWEGGLLCVWEKEDLRQENKVRNSVYPWGDILLTGFDLFSLG